jgi:hypothetical protein
MQQSTTGFRPIITGPNDVQIEVQDIIFPSQQVSVYLEKHTKDTTVLKLVIGSTREIRDVVFLLLNHPLSPCLFFGYCPPCLSPVLFPDLFAMPYFV